MKLKKVLLIALMAIIVLCIILFFILNSFMHTNLSELNGSGKLEESYISPNGKYRADLFLINKGGATVAYQQRVSITSLEDKRNKFEDDTIYWVYPSVENTSVKWKNSDDIVINGITISIENPDTYYNYKEDDH